MKHQKGFFLIELIIVIAIIGILGTVSTYAYWSFIPPNLLSQLKYISHAADTSVARSGKTHQYFVDGPVVAADVWLAEQRQ